MIENELYIYIFAVFVIAVIISLSTGIPVYGFLRKRWKGACLGCLLQPIVCIALSILILSTTSFYQKRKIQRNHNAAMITLRKTAFEAKDSLEHTYLWYVKTDDECLFEDHRADEKDSFTDALSKMKLLDVIPSDSTSLCVDDRVVVRFDLKARQASATDYGEPIEVVSINWDRVTDYFSAHD